jgi:hypothetical protein
MMDDTHRYQIRPLGIEELPLWLAFSHEYDRYIEALLPDVSRFYRGFDRYMMQKIHQHEAFILEDHVHNHVCCGILAVSKSGNRITYFGIAEQADVEQVGQRLIQYALSQLDQSRDITVNVVKSDADIFVRVRVLFEAAGFVVQDGTVMEEGVPAYLLKRASGERHA